MLQIKGWILCANMPLMSENKANINIILAAILDKLYSIRISSVLYFVKRFEEL